MVDVTMNLEGRSVTSVVLTAAAVSFGVYSTLSFVLLRKPHWWHKPLPKERQLPEIIRNVKVVGHRGSRLQGLPENTIAAFKDAINSFKNVNGMIELDVWLSSDGEVLIHHDPTLERMCGETALITDSHSKNLPAIKPYEGQKEKVGKWEDVTEATRIPTFAEVLPHLPSDVPLIVEFKQLNVDLITKVHTLLEKHSRLPHQDGNTVWFSLTEEINIALHTFDPTVPRIRSAMKTIQLAFDYHTGLLPFRSLDNDCIFGVVASKVDFARLRGMSGLKMLPDFVCHLLVFLFGGDPPKALLSKGMVNHLTKRGFPVMILDVNNEAQLDACVRCGATAVLTDAPSWIVTEHKPKLEALHTVTY